MGLTAPRAFSNIFNRNKKPIHGDFLQDLANHLLYQCVGGESFFTGKKINFKGVEVFFIEVEADLARINLNGEIYTPHTITLQKADGAPMFWDKSYTGTYIPDSEMVLELPEPSGVDIDLILMDEEWE